MQRRECVAIWKRLTRHGSDDGGFVDVNIDAVVYMEHADEYTTLRFAVVGAEAGRLHRVRVTETPDEIHKAKPLLSSQST
jgi:hypothetical protein